MNEKKIEPTQAMVEAGASYAWEETNPGILGWNSISEHHKEGCRRDARSVLAAALNHPDARGLFTDEDDRPWEPLSKGDPLNVGDEVRREAYGITVTAVVGRVDGGGNLWTIEGGLLIHSESGTWHVRRAVQELPEEDGAVIVRKGERIEARHAGKTWVATEAVLVDGEWRGTWFEKGRATGDWNVMWAMSPDRIIPDTCQVADQ